MLMVVCLPLMTCRTRPKPRRKRIGSQAIPFDHSKVVDIT